MKHQYSHHKQHHHQQQQQQQRQIKTCNENLYRKSKYKTFQNLHSPTEVTDIILVFIKVFLIIGTLGLIVLRGVKFMFHKVKKIDKDLEKAIDELSKILFRTMLIIYMLICVVVLINFREYWTIAAEKGRQKMGDIIHDSRKIVGYSPCPKSPSKSHIKKFTEGIKTFASTVRKSVPVSTVGNLAANAIDHIKDEEFEKYTCSLVWWQNLFFILILIGLWNYKGDNPLIELAA